MSAGWFEATYEPDHSLNGLAIRLLPWVAMLAATVSFSLVQLLRSSRTTAFVLDAAHRAFRTGLRPEAVWWAAVMAVAYTAAFWSFAPSTWDDGTGPEWQLTVVEVAMTVALGVVTLTLLGFQLFARWAALPAIVLTTDGVRLLSAFGYRAVPWDALRPGYPPRPGRRDRVLPLATERSALARRRGLSFVPLSFLDVHPWFLADAIRHYAAHPEHRTAIGTPEEHDRLRRLLLHEGVVVER